MCQSIAFVTERQTDTYYQWLQKELLEGCKIKLREGQGMVGGGGFECAGGTQALFGIALPASGGPRSGLEFIKPFASLTGLQEFLSFSGCLVIGKFLSV